MRRRVGDWLSRSRREGMSRRGGEGEEERVFEAAGDTKKGW